MLRRHTEFCKERNLASCRLLQKGPLLPIRILHLSILALCLNGLSPLFAAQLGPPTESRLESGDLLWPKNPNAIIPYRAATGLSEEEEWRQERDQYVATLRKKLAPSKTDEERLKFLPTMSFGQFQAAFQEGLPPEKPAPNANVAGVGHVAIVRIRDSKVTVVEAVWKEGVREVPYGAWRKQHEQDLVWLGRLEGVSPSRRSEIAERAAQQVGKPYSFWNFNLTDDSGFYCSKLAWLSIFQATGSAIDGDENPDRRLLLSPKQLLHSRRLKILQDAGAY